KRAEQKAEKAARAADAVVDPAAQAKRAGQREARVAAGLDFLETWLCDIVRGGLAALPSRPYQFWDGVAARLVDAQAGGVAGRVRAPAAIPASGDGWQERLLEQLGLLYLLIEGFRRLDALPPATQADIRAAIGWNVNQDELIAAGAGVRDRWFVA